MSDMQRRIKMLEETIAQLKASMVSVTDALDTAIMTQVTERPQTIDELSKSLKRTRAIVRSAVGRMAWSETVRMVSEKGQKRERFRVYPADRIKGLL